MLVLSSTSIGTRQNKTVNQTMKDKIICIKDSFAMEYNVINKITSRTPQLIAVLRKRGYLE